MLVQLFFVVGDVTDQFLILLIVLSVTVIAIELCTALVLLRVPTQMT